jgi:chemotaxis protein MotB
LHRRELDADLGDLLVEQRHLPLRGRRHAPLLGEVAARRAGAVAEFRSNWELSAARAITVAQHLIDAGVPPERLAATGFGEFHPLDEGESEVAYRSNRRIELKLTER